MVESPGDHCEECGFEASRWRVRDVGSLFFDLGRWWRLATEGLDEALLSQRPVEEGTTILEHGWQCAAECRRLRAEVALALAEDGCTLASEVDGPNGARLREDLVAALEIEGEAMARLTLHPLGWSNVARRPDGTAVSAETIVSEAAHELSHRFMAVGRLLAETVFAPRADGRVAQVNVSGGGVPKLPIGEGIVGWWGVEGDRQANRTHHGRPFQALCLWSSEVIASLAADGHPISAGCGGENLTLAGLDWPALRPGTRLMAGDVVLELSSPAVPCQKQARWFADGDFSRIAYEQHPEWVRWYGWVRRPGRVRPGDGVVVWAP